MATKTVEFVCPACGQETFLKRTPRYEGFTKTGEDFSCASCGHVFPDEKSVPFKEKKAITIFNESDRPESISVFKPDEGKATCRHCANYVVNPFIQRCSLQQREVEATDTCDCFRLKENIETEEDKK